LLERRIREWSREKKKDKEPSFLSLSLSFSSSHTQSNTHNGLLERRVLSVIATILFVIFVDNILLSGALICILRRTPCNLVRERRERERRECVCGERERESVCACVYV
jgi:hypothetical protein